MKFLILLILMLTLSACGNVTLPNGETVLPESWTEKDQALLGSDKGLHLLLGTGTATVTRTIVRETNPEWDRTDQMIAGCVASTTVGIAKEVYDRDIMGTRFETADAVYTAAGCLLTFEWIF